MSSIFSKIIRGKIPCHKVAEDEHHLAFFDIQALQKGHTLVIPKSEVDYIFDLDDEQTTNLHLFAKRVAIAIKKTIPCAKVGMAVVGLEVPHTHIHLVPINSVSDMNFSGPRIPYDSNEFENLAKQIRQNFS